jgi:hypothetical protein
MNMKNLWSLVVLAAFVGCASPAPAPAWEHEKGEVIEILSDPPGARIEINDEFMGEAPVTVTVHRKMRWGVMEDLRVNALPKGIGCAQHKDIASLQPTPKKMFFDTGLCKRGTVDINLKQE